MDLRTADREVHAHKTRLRIPIYKVGIPVRCTPEITVLTIPKVYLKLVLIVDDELLSRQGVGWHTAVYYGGPERFGSP